MDIWTISLGQAVVRAYTSATRRHQATPLRERPTLGARVYNLAQHYVQYIQHAQAPDIAELAAKGARKLDNLLTTRRHYALPIP